MTLQKINVHVASGPIDWRDEEEEDDPDDEVLAKTPEDVIMVLGFDPLED